MTGFLRRYRWWVLGAMGLVLVGLAVLAENRSGSGPVLGSLGPTPGPDSSGYVAAKTDHLRALARTEPETRAAALVSLERLLRPIDVAELVGAADVDVVFVNFPGANPEALVVTGTVAVTVGARAAEMIEVLEAEVEALEAEAGGADEARKAELLTEASERRSEINGLRECFCIYALTVDDTTVRSLAELAGREEVRLVDLPDPPVPSLRGWELTPLLPPRA